MAMLGRDALSVEILEDPLSFLTDLTDHYLHAGEIWGDLSGVPPKGWRRRSRRLAEIVSAVVDVAYALPEAAQEAIRAWANVHRQFAGELDAGRRHCPVTWPSLANEGPVMVARPSSSSSR